jgi:uncharacterized protein DUF6680
MKEIIIAVATVIAIVAGPVLALEMQRRLDKGREERNRKLTIFKTLMAYRATSLAPQFVQSLNLIDVEFNAAAEKPVRDAWKVLLDHFVELGKDANLLAKTPDLTADLLEKMGKCLGYDFDPVYIKKGAYYPQGLGNVEQEQHALRREFLELLRGKRKLPIAVFEDRFPDLVKSKPSDKPPAGA